jgi:hypothetical protein
MMNYCDIIIYYNRMGIVIYLAIPSDLNSEIAKSVAIYAIGIALVSTLFAFCLPKGFLHYPALILSRIEYIWLSGLDSMYLYISLMFWLMLRPHHLGRY